MNEKYNEKCDLWSCGVILYLMIAGYPPFYSQSNQEVANLIIKAEASFKGIFYAFIRSYMEKS